MSRNTALFIILFFIITRIGIWIYKPTQFSEILYSYMPYAHLWASGTQPYLDQWYEYPPLTIPLFYAPHMIDESTRQFSWHLDYGEAYRGILMTIDCLVFAMVWRWLIFSKAKKNITIVSLLYYILLTTKANHFIYDTMDLVFAAALVLSATAPLYVSKNKNNIEIYATYFQRWLGYWAATALKLLNIPLGLPLLLLEKIQLKKNIIIATISGAILWAIPVLLYRSSLSVMLVYQQMRGLQIDSFGATVVRVINLFTGSEEVIEVFKNFEISGTITTTALLLVNSIFILGIIFFTLFMSWQAWRLKENQKNTFRLSMTLGYVLLLMISSKVLSQPFMLWHIPLLAMMPFENTREQLKFLIPSALIIVITLTQFPLIIIGPVTSALIIGIIRSLLFVYLFYIWCKWHQQFVSTKV